VKPQSISVRIGRVVWHGHGAIPADALAHAIGGAIADRLETPRPDGRAPIAAKGEVAETVADAVVERLEGVSPAIGKRSLLPPLPPAGEGWGEGASPTAADPHPPPSPASGRRSQNHGPLK